MIVYPESRPFEYQPPPSKLGIVHVDDHIVVIDKPSGLLSVPGKTDAHKDCVESRLRDEYPDALTVHRIDVGTSGLMVFARNKPAQRHLGLQFEKRYIEKSYAAIIFGSPRPDSGYINLPIITDWPNRPRQKIDFINGRSAQTHWVKGAPHTHGTRVHLYPKTGRSHQLRLHMLALGHPILGDQIYAHDASYHAAERLLLHADRLSLRHPVGGKVMQFECPAPF